MKGRSDINPLSRQSPHNLATPIQRAAEEETKLTMHLISFRSRKITVKEPLTTRCR